jgi:MFS family permease
VLFAAAGLRSFVTGLTGVLLGLYLARLEVAPATVGLVVGLGLAGNALGTALVALGGERLGRRRLLVASSLLSAAGLAAMALTGVPALLGAAAFLGMVNGMGRDRGPAQSLDHSLLADWATDAERTRRFARYALVQDALGAGGALAASVPAFLSTVFGVPGLAGHRWVLAGAAGLSLLTGALYATLPPTLGPRRPTRGPISPDSRRRLVGLSTLFAVDSLGGGLIAGSVLSYWFFRRFELDGAALGPVFFAARILNALSYLVAERLARRIGLVRTMVFTHFPSSLLLFVLPFAPTPAAAITVFLLRESLVQMDVPTRESYVGAVTQPGERTFAFGVTGLVRNVGWAFGPPLAGLAISAWGLAAPLLAGAGLKSVYDLALYASYRGVAAPEEKK